MVFLHSFLVSLFFACVLGVVFNFGLAAYFFIRNKKRYNEYTWWSFKIPTYFLLFTAGIGYILYIVK